LRFPIVIHKDPDSEYGVTVPDLLGCFSAAETLDEAFGAAKEAIECHLERLLLDGDPFPNHWGLKRTNPIWITQVAPGASWKSISRNAPIRLAESTSAYRCAFLRW
jgi:predicted RNase H-like HicB family nuclease